MCKHYLLLAAVLYTLLQFPSRTDAQTRSMTGRVIDADSRERLPYASITIKGTKAGTLTNVEGFFLLHALPDSVFVLQIAYLGYSTLEQTIDPAEEVENMMFRLKQAPISLEGVTVSAMQTNIIKTETVPSMTTISPIQITSLPSIGQVDIFRSLQLLPGISGTNDGSSGLYVRGGTPDQNLVLYDGMTVYHVDHFFGFFSAFNPDALKDVQIYKGAFPAKFGGRLSSVIDLVGKSGNTEETHGEVGASLMSVDGSLQLPLWGTSLFVAGRRSYSDIISGGIYDKLYKFLTGSNTPQGAGSTRGGRGFGQGFSQQQTPTSAFSDLNAKLTYAFSPRYLLSASYYGSADNYDLSSQTSTQNQGGFGGQFQVPGRTNNTQQGNNGASTKLFAQWKDNFYSTVVFAYDGYKSSFSSNNESRNPA
ncbi:MAG: TonB-dependent receptor [Ignavibacteriales bacterium]|nr:TonB-dependent receptor [Ignavibacteriales bacterium]